MTKLSLYFLLYARNEFGTGGDKQDLTINAVFSLTEQIGSYKVGTALCIGQDLHFAWTSWHVYGNT